MARKDKDVIEGRGSAPVSLAALFPEARFVGADDIVAFRCTAKADRCDPGDVFVACLDDDGDGHEEVTRAIARGARAIVAERMIPSAGVPVCLVPDSAWALARLAHACCGDPGARLRIVAITGTSGKTTTAWLTASVLAEAGLTVGVLSDLGCLDAEACLPEAAELRDPEVVAAWLARLVASGCTDAVVEVSSEMLAAQVLAGVGCETVVVTNLASAHLDAHGTVEAYRAIKERILASIRPDGCLVFNADDRRVCRLADRHQGPRIAIGLQGAVDVTARPVERSLSGQTVLVSAAGHAAAVSFDTPTAGFVRDALLAAAVGLRRRVPLERVARGLESAGSVPGRLARIDRGQEATVFVDRASSGHALGGTLSSLRHLAAGRLILVAHERAAAALGGARRFRGRVAKWCDTVVLVPANVLDEAPDEAASAAYARVDRLLAQAGPDDCVVVLDEKPSAGGMPGDPVTAGPLVVLVDGWLQLAHPPVWGGRRAA